MAAAHCELTGIPPMGLLARATSMPLHRQSSLDAFRRRVQPLTIEFPATADEPAQGVTKPLDIWDINYDEIFPQCARLAEQFSRASLSEQSAGESKPPLPLSEAVFATRSPNHQRRFEDTAVRLTSSTPPPTDSPSSGAADDYFRDVRSRVLGCTLGTPCTVSLANSRQQDVGSRSQDAGRFEELQEEAVEMRGLCWARKGKSSSLGGASTDVNEGYCDYNDGVGSYYNHSIKTEVSYPRCLTKQTSEPRMSGPALPRYWSPEVNDVPQPRARSFALDRLPVASICDAYLGLDDLDDDAFSNDEALFDEGRLFIEECNFASESSVACEEVTGNWTEHQAAKEY